MQHAKRTISLLAAVAALLAVVAITAWNSRAGQDWLLEKALTAAMNAPSEMSRYEGLKVFFCGTSSPLPAPGRAQACVAILAGDSLYLVDAGAGSAQVAALGRLPLQNLRGVFLTHFHSDHIAALPEFNLNSWVAGRSTPLTVYGPVGVAKVVEGLNQAYQLDLTYRVAHHGEALLPPELGPMQSSLLQAGTVSKFDELSISSFEVNHDPVRPALGYRFDYRGRSVVISGDTIITDTLIEAANDADVVMQDSLSLPIIQAMEKAATGTRMEKILFDIQDYHAHTSDLARLVDQSGARQLILYHLIPAPQNALFEKIFERDMPDGTIISEDGMMIELPANSEEIRVVTP